MAVMVALQALQRFPFHSDGGTTGSSAGARCCLAMDCRQANSVHSERYLFKHIKAAHALELNMCALCLPPSDSSLM